MHAMKMQPILASKPSSSSSSGRVGQANIATGGTPFSIIPHSKCYAILFLSNEVFVPVNWIHAEWTRWDLVCLKQVSSQILLMQPQEYLHVANAKIVYPRLISVTNEWIFICHSHAFMSVWIDAKYRCSTVGRKTSTTTEPCTSQTVAM